MIQIKLIGMSMISYYTKVHLSKSNGSWVASTKPTMNFNIQTTAMFVFFVFDKNGLIKSCSSFGDISMQNFMVPRWLVQVLHPPQKFEHAPFWNGWRYGIKLRRRGHLQWHDFPTEFHKNLPIALKVIREGEHTDGQTDRLEISQASLSFLRKVG
jgi:hypothetical protein